MVWLVLSLLILMCGCSVVTPMPAHRVGAYLITLCCQLSFFGLVVDEELMKSIGDGWRNWRRKWQRNHLRNVREGEKYLEEREENRSYGFVWPVITQGPTSFLCVRGRELFYRQTILLQFSSLHRQRILFQFNALINKCIRQPFRQ